MKQCIAVLTRGYENITGYDTLIKRNKHISVNLNNKLTDILIFHEGNIKEEHQIFIKNETLELNIIFMDISHIAFQPDKKNIIVKEAPRFQIGYRHMCSFWFVNFFEVVKEYNKLLRIDEDCFIDSNIDNILSQLDNFVFVVAQTKYDHEFVTKGLNKFSLDFVNNFKEKFVFKNSNTKKPYGPYTNLIGLSLDEIRNNKTFEDYRLEVDKSNMIYERRWGDLPLWGEVIYYIFGEYTLKLDRNIRYFHESHNAYIN